VEPAFRFGYFNPDSKSGNDNAIDDQEEYNLAVNYFIHGHDLKLQTGVAWEVTNYSGGGSDLVDFRFETQLRDTCRGESAVT